jgi:hypothetical protein
MFKHYYHKCNECGDTHTYVLEWPRMILVGIIIGALFFFPLGMTYQQGKDRAQILEEWRQEGQ